MHYCPGTVHVYIKHKDHYALFYSFRNRPCFPVVYTTQGTFVAASFSGQCLTCQKKYYVSYSESEDGVQTFYNPDTMEAKYFMHTSQTAFEIKLLKELSAQLALASVTFESQAEVYNALHSSEDVVRLRAFEEKFRRCDGEDCWRLNVRRLEDCWFTYQLAFFFGKHHLLDTIDFGTQTTAGNRKDVEDLCRKANLHLSQITPEWLHHVCNVKGCREGLATIDGNEKIRRSMCAAPKSKVPIPHNSINIMQCCPSSPITGGRHQKPSKYCARHQHLEAEGNDGIDDSSLVVRIPLPTASFSPPFTVDSIGDLPDADSDSVLVGCRKAKNVDKFFSTTAGIATIVRPCGIVVNCTEMYTCESPTQMYIFLLSTFGRGKDIDRLKFLAYDRACDLHPFLVNLQKKDVYLAKFLLKNVKFLVDIWHVQKHTEPCCQPPSSQQDPGRYHPLHPAFEPVRAANTECAEQCFRWLNKFKTIVRKMKQHRFSFFLHTMINLHNFHREKQLKENGLM